MNLNGSHVLVTGASRGLGRSIAAAYVAAGASVIGIGRDRSALSETAEGCRGYSGTFVPRVVDLLDETAIIGLFDGLPELDICVNNAGIAGRSPFLETTTEELRRVFETDVVAAFVVMRETLRFMVGQGYGRLVNIASDAAYTGFSGMAAYVASKHALHGLARTASLELTGRGVSITSVFPGSIRTTILGDESLSPGGMEPATVARLIVAITASADGLDVTEVHLQPQALRT